ncbi:MAG TPA: hypothetical protein VHG53_03625 [Candidatus Limnocylindria bacterium]|nr:hypothetical protein [Candidatus Limnocylindria bacterium]
MMNRQILTAFLVACLVVAGASVGSERAAADTCDTPLSATPTSTAYLPNVTKTLATRPAGRRRSSSRTPGA